MFKLTREAPPPTFLYSPDGLTIEFENVKLDYIMGKEACNGHQIGLLKKYKQLYYDGKEAVMDCLFDFILRNSNI